MPSATMQYAVLHILCDFAATILHIMCDFAATILHIMCDYATGHIAQTVQLCNGPDGTKKQATKQLTNPRSATGQEGRNRKHKVGAKQAHQQEKASHERARDDFVQ
eukprot:1141191-Pelagomonas_calceolata.AAC.2